MRPLRVLAVGGEAGPVTRLLGSVTGRPVESLGSLATLPVLLAAGPELAVDLVVWWTPDPVAGLDDLRALGRLRPGLAWLVVVLRPEAAGPSELALEACRQRGEVRAVAVAGPDEASLRVAVARLAALQAWPVDEGSAPTVAAAAVNGSPVAPAGARGRVVTVFSPKGGSGKTTIALNLAALAAAGPGGCALVDLDLETPDATALSGAPGGSDLVDLLPLLGAEAGAQLPLGRHRQAGFHLVPGPARPELAPLVQPAHVTALLSGLRQRFGVVVVDTCGRLSDDATLAALEGADHILLVVLPEPSSVRRAAAAMELMARVGWRPSERVRLVVNAAAADAPVDVPRIEALLGVQALARIPHDAAAMRRAALAGVPLAVAEPDHPLVRATARILAALGLEGSTPGPRTRARGWRGFVRRVLGEAHS